MASAVLDTTVLVSALLNPNPGGVSNDLLRFAKEGVFDLLLSDDLLAKTSIAYAVPPREYFFRDWLNAVLLNLEENGKIKDVLAKWTR